jgi:hypothetical protein
MRRGALATFVGFLALALFWTWPLAAHFSSRVPHDPGDPILNVWLLWWNAQAVPFTARWWSPPIFHPMQGALGLSEHLAGIGVVTTPLQFLGAPPLAAYNAALILSFALSGFFAFLLVRRLAGPGCDGASAAIGACCAGLAYGFGPYRAGQLAHIQVLTSQWMPLALFAMHAYLDDGKRRWLALFAVAWLVQALSNGYYLLFFPVLIALWLAWFVDWRRAYPRGLALAATWIVASIPLVPVLLKYAAIHRALGLSRQPGEMAAFSATPESFLHASRMLALWPTALTPSTEVFLFPGVTAVTLVIAGGAVGLVRRRRQSERRSASVFYAAAAAIMWGLALGPTPPDGWPRPYSLLIDLPGFNSLRVPARFAMLATLCFSVAAGLAAVRVLWLLAERRALRAVVAAVAVAGLLADGLMRSMPLAVPPGRVIMPAVADALVVELPANHAAIDTAAMYRSMQHGRPLVNGYSGHTPPHYRILSQALRRMDPSGLIELARGRPLVISVNGSFDDGGQVQRLVEGIPGIQSRGSWSSGAMFVLPALPAARLTPIGEPWPATIGAPGGPLTIDLGAARVVRTIGFALRWRYQDLDRRLTIEGSLDGQAWSTVWEDWTGGPAVIAAAQQPLEVPVRLTVPDITARYLRVHPAPPWLRREIKVYGPK